MCANRYIKGTRRQPIITLLDCAIEPGLIRFKKHDLDKRNLERVRF